MTERTLFFNEAWWRRFLQNEQSVAYLRELWRRAGGAQPPDLDQDEIVNQITSIDQSVSGQGQSLNRVRQIANQMANELGRDPMVGAQVKSLSTSLNQVADELGSDRVAMLSALKKMSNAINRLADEAQTDRATTISEIKNLKHRINQLEDAQ